MPLDLESFVTRPVGEPKAELSSGGYSAVLAGIDPDETIGLVLDKDTVRGLRKYCRRYDLDQPETLREIPVLPLRLIDGYLDEGDWPTRAEVAADAADQGEDDPHELMDRLEVARRKRRDENLREKVERATSGETDGVTRAEMKRRAAVALEVDRVRVRDLATQHLQQERWRETMGEAAESSPFIGLADAEQMAARTSIWGERVLCAGSVYELLGPPGSGKTFFAAGLVAAMAMDQPRFLGGALAGGNSLVIEAEGADILGVRLAAAACQLGAKYPAKELADKVSMTRHAMNLADPSHIEKITAECTRIDAKLVVIDTRARNTIGVEENSATAMGQVYEHLAAIARRTGAAVVVIHHTAKNGAGSRGSSAGTGAIDGELLIRREFVQTDTFKRRVHFVSLGEKTRLADDSQEFAFTLDAVTVPRGSYAPDNPAYDEDSTRQTCQVVSVDPLDLPTKVERGQASDIAKAAAESAIEHRYAEAVLRFVAAEKAAGRLPAPSVLIRKARRPVGLTEPTETVAARVVGKLTAARVVDPLPYVCDPQGRTWRPELIG